MSVFTQRLQLEQIGEKKWKLLKSFSYHVGSEDSEEIITVREGFVCDGASIPKLFWTIIGRPFGRYAQCAVLHDWMYQHQMYTRRKADVIFFRSMRAMKVPFMQRWLMFRSVRLFAWSPWNKYKRDLPI